MSVTLGALCGVSVSSSGRASARAVRVRSNVDHTVLGCSTVRGAQISTSKGGFASGDGHTMEPLGDSGARPSDSAEINNNAAPRDAGHQQMTQPPTSTIGGAPLRVSSSDRPVIAAGSHPPGTSHDRSVFHGA